MLFLSLFTARVLNYFLLAKAFQNGSSHLITVMTFDVIFAFDNGIPSEKLQFNNSMLVLCTVFLGQTLSFIEEGPRDPNF